MHISAADNTVRCACSQDGRLALLYVAFDLGRFDTACYAAAAIALPPRIAQAVPKRQAEFFYGRLCARAALLRQGWADVEVGSGPKREPLWPAGVVGSITHSHGIAAAVVMPEQLCNGVGIDIEDVVDGDGALALSQAVLSARELAYLRTLVCPLPWNTLLTLVFSAKESFYKAVFETVRRYLDFDVIEIVAVDMAARRLHFDVRQPVTAAFSPGVTVTVDFMLPGPAQVCTSFLW